MPASASRSPPLFVGQSLLRSLVTKYFAKGVLRCPGSGYVARFTAQRDRISLHTTLYFLVDGLRRGARTSGSSCLCRRCLSISALFRASTMDCSKYGNGRQHDNSLFHRASLTKTKEAASGFQAGIPDHEPKEKGCRGSWDGSPKYGVNQRRERGWRRRWLP